MASDEEKSISLAKSNELMLNTIEVCDEEKKNLLAGVLECAVCLELPKKKQKVMICEQGHHFCSNCHGMIEKCGICRGKLLKSRNFVVEELVTKLGPILGVKGTLPPPEVPPKYTSGSYQCQHDCPAKTPPHLMLPHIRSQHASNLIDNMRSNPYNGQFSFAFNVQYKTNEKYVISTHVSDFGLFTLIIIFKDLNLFGFVKMLGDTTISSRFKCQLGVKITSKNPPELIRQFSISNCSVSSYNDDTESILNKGNVLKIREITLLDHINIGNVMSVFFSVQKNQKMEKKKYARHLQEIVADKPLAFCNDRKIRRNKSRNMRRKRLREKFKKLTISSDKETNDLEDISMLFNNL